MKSLFPILMIAAALSVLASLMVGLFFMVRAKEGDAKLSNKAMQWRIGLQALALALFAIALSVGNG